MQMHDQIVAAMDDDDAAVVDVAVRTHYTNKLLLLTLDHVLSWY